MTGPFGGLLADAMGMGKTVETLATMVTSRAIQSKSFIDT
jgi:SNF2 family DNA or RNA helicase